MMNPLRSAPFFLVPAAVLLAGVAPAAHAQTVFTANLTNSQENPPVTPTLQSGLPRPASFGTATFTLNAAQTTLTFTATVNNIDFTGSQTPDTFDNLTAAHIHAGPNLPPLNNPVVWGFFGLPFNDTNLNTVVTPFATGVGGTVIGTWDAPEGNNTNLAAQLPNLFAGRAYLNFHTTQFPGGEIRGQIVPVPEPGAVATGVMLAGTLAFGIVRGRRRTSVRPRI
jgi:hypothetical protein